MEPIIFFGLAFGGVGLCILAIVCIIIGTTD